MKKSRLLGAVCTIVLTCGYAAESWSATVNISAYSRGYFDDLGWNNVFNTDANDYHVGITSNGNQNNYTLYDLSAFSGMEVISASVKYYQNGSGKYWYGADTLALYDISTSIDLVDNAYNVSSSFTTTYPNITGQSIYNDLQSGVVLGSTSVINTYPSAQWINIVFNSAGLADINTYIGSLYGIGGTCTTCLANSTGQGNDDYLLGFSSEDGQAILTLELQALPAAVPVPAAIWLFGSGLLGLIGVARHKKA